MMYRNALFVLSLAVGCTSASNPLEGERWELYWEDEFKGEAGASPNPDHWDFDIGGEGWGNEQLEFNTDRPENVALDGNGFLRIHALREQYEGNAWTSARIKTKDKFEFTYGRVEAKILLPEGMGFWPAFWMLGANIEERGWPLCGEIDILEARGNKPREVHGSLHGPGYSGGEPITSTYNFPEESTGISDFHTYRIDWDPDHIAWYVDDQLYQTAHPGDASGAWAFDQDFFLLLNLAVGGVFLPNPDATTPDTGLMAVDWVRVYKRKTPLPDPDL